MTIAPQHKLTGTPIAINVETFKYLLPTLSVNPMAVTFGKPLVGKPIAQEHNIADAITNRFGCGSGNERPISATNGTVIKAATVCETNVAITKTSDPKTAKTVKSSASINLDWIPDAKTVKRPETETALPNAKPPIARITMVHG